MSATKSSTIWATWCVVASAAAVAFILLACGGGPASVGFTIDNRTDAALCEYPSAGDAALAKCRSELDPKAEGAGGRDCDARRDRSFTVILTVKKDGREIFKTTGTCGEWHDTRRTFTIEQEGDEFIVTNNVPTP